MNIAIDARCLHGVKSGIYRYTYIILDELQKIDKNNNYFLFAKNKTNFKINNPNWKEIIKGKFILGVLWTHTVLPWLIFLYDIDVFWSPHYICPLFKRKKTKFITTIHDLTFFKYPSTMNSLYKMVVSFLINFSIKYSSFLCVVSNKIKQELIEKYPYLSLKKISIVYNSSPNWKIPDNYSFNLRQNFLFFPANLEPRKNLINLLKALAILKKKGHIIKLHISSPAMWKSKNIFQFINQENLTNQIIFCGFLSENELIQKYLTCKAVVYPSIYEGFGIPVLEGLKMDCIVLTSKNTAMEEIAGKYAIYFDPKDPVDIAEKVLDTINGKYDNIRIQDNKQQWLEKYSSEKSAKIMLDLFIE
jgi:glycosyltransferase involved in cell wall biosynthesis